MQDIISQLHHLIVQNQAWAGPVVGLVAGLESIFIVGALIPATPLLLVVGGLIGAGAIDPLPILAWAVFGAIAGDALSYWVGRRVGPGLTRRPFFNRHKEAVARARLFFRRYGFASIFFGRYFGPVRCTVPMVAGMMGMPHRVFQFANIASALVWAPVVLLPGFFAGRGAQLLDRIGEGRVTGIVLVVTIGTMGATVVFSHLIARHSTKRPSRLRREARAAALKA